MFFHSSLQSFRRNAVNFDASVLYFSGAPCVSKRSLTPDKQVETHTTVDGFVRERRVSPARYPVNQVTLNAKIIVY